MIKQIDSSQNSLMQNKFLKVFGTQFKGHKEHLMKHLDNIRRKFMNE
jgi:predicted phosphohydrolase